MNGLIIEKWDGKSAIFTFDDVDKSVVKQRFARFGENVVTNNIPEWIDTLRNIGWRVSIDDDGIIKITK